MHFENIWRQLARKFFFTCNIKTNWSSEHFVVEYLVFFRVLSTALNGSIIQSRTNQF